jgi:hypothetical protein
MSIYYLSVKYHDADTVRNIRMVQQNKLGVHKKDDRLTCWGTCCETCFECTTETCHFCQDSIWECTCTADFNIRLNPSLMDLHVSDYIALLP